MKVSFAPGDLVRARGREWVALPPPRDGILALRPLSGSEYDMVILDPDLETLPLTVARFDLPVDAAPTVQSKAALLADALRLTLRRGAGPFRSAAQLAFEPRTYQLVPLLMALRLQVPRLLIADDVGIGKTIEAGLILRELMDRGEVDAFSVLCPPHLVEQWVGELKFRFGIEAVAVTAGSAAHLERGLTPRPLRGHQDRLPGARPRARSAGASGARRSLLRRQIAPPGDRPPAQQGLHGGALPPCLAFRQERNGPCELAGDGNRGTGFGL